MKTRRELLLESKASLEAVADIICIPGDHETLLVHIEKIKSIYLEMVQLKRGARKS